MTTQANSFDISPAGAFVESRAGARNLVSLRGPEGTVDPIIFMITSVRQIMIHRWLLFLGDPYFWHGGEEGYLVGPPYYDENPGAFVNDMAALMETFSIHQEFDYGAIGKVKPNWQIQIWQPVVSWMIDNSFVLPNPPGGLFVLPANDFSHLVAQDWGGALPGFVEFVSIPLAAQPFNHAIVTTDRVITDIISGPENTTTAVDLSVLEIGGYYHRAQMSWLPQDLLIPWRNFMRNYEGLSPVYINPGVGQNRAEVTIKPQYIPGTGLRQGFVYDPFWLESYRAGGIESPASELVRFMRQAYTPPLDEVRVLSGEMQRHWPLEARTIMQNRMR